MKSNQTVLPFLELLVPRLGSKLIHTKFKVSLKYNFALRCTHLDPEILSIVEIPSCRMANQITAIIWLLNQAAIPKFLQRYHQIFYG